MTAPEPTPATPTPNAEAVAPAQGEPKHEPSTPEASPAKPETDWRAEARKWEARAKENKTAADRLAEIEDAQKTELQRFQDRAVAAEKRAQELEAKQQVADWKAEIARDPAFAGVPANVLRGTTQEELLAHAAELKSLLPDPNARNGAYVAGEGRTTTAALSPAQQFAELLQKQTHGGSR